MNNRSINDDKIGAVEPLLPSDTQHLQGNLEARPLTNYPSHYFHFASSSKLHLAFAIAAASRC